MKVQLLLAVSVLVLVKSYSIPRVEIHTADEHLLDIAGTYGTVQRERRSPQGGIDFGPDHYPGGDSLYDHEIWRGRNGQFDHGGYSGQYEYSAPVLTTLALRPKPYRYWYAADDDGGNADCPTVSV